MHFIMGTRNALRAKPMLQLCASIALQLALSIKAQARAIVLHSRVFTVFFWCALQPPTHIFTQTRGRISFGRMLYRAGLMTWRSHRHQATGALDDLPPHVWTHACDTRGLQGTPVRAACSESHLPHTHTHEHTHMYTQTCRRIALGYMLCRVGLMILKRLFRFPPTAPDAPVCLELLFPSSLLRSFCVFCKPFTCFGYLSMSIR